MLFIKKKGLSPLVATILIIVVVVTLVAMVSSWGKVFTLTNLSLANKVSEKSSLSDFVWQDNLLENNLFVKNTNSKISETIIRYKINSFLDYSFLNNDRNLDFDIVLAKNGFATIPLVCVPEPKFSVDLITSNGDYINVPVIAKYFDESECTFSTEITTPANNYLARSGVQIIFTSSLGNTSGLETCQWTSDKDGVLSSACDFNSSSLSINTHLITFSVTDSDSTLDKNITIIVNPPLGLSINSPINASGYLVGTQVEFISTIDSNYGVYSCSWDSNIDNTLSTSCDFNKSDLSVGNHLITLSVTDDLETITTTVQTTIKTNLVPTISSPSNNSDHDVGSSINFIGTASNTQGSYTCAWDSNVSGSLGAGCNINVSSLSVGAHLITLSVTDTLETQTVSEVITISYPPVSVSITAPTTGASYETSTSISFNSSISGGNGVYTCAWTANGSSFSTSCGSFSYSSFTVAGTYTILLSVTDGVGNNSSDSISLTLTKVYVVGDVGPAGGKIFYKKSTPSNGWQYMEVKNTDESASTGLGCNQTLIGGTSTALGTGLENTNAYYAGCGESTGAIAQCYNLSSGGYTDWFLGSKDEMTTLRTSGQHAVQSHFMTSSETAATQSWHVHLVYYPNENIWGKNDPYNRVCLRRF